MVHVYGIPNCNTVKKAVDWLHQHEVEYVFHNYKKEGIAAGKLAQWCAEFGWEKLVNKKGTTWRKLPPEQQEKINGEKAAIAFMMENPSVIKRPVIEKGKDLLIGFDTDEYTGILDPKG